MHVPPGEVCVVQCGMRFSVDLLEEGNGCGGVRGYGLALRAAARCPTSCSCRT